MLQYGGLERDLNLLLTAMLQYGYNFIRHSKEVAKAVRFETHNWKILGSNPAALTISFFKEPILIVIVRTFSTKQHAGRK